MASHNKLGEQGEKVAAKYLEDNGYSVLEQNWRCRKIEIDIIACNKEFLIFVEVKTRASAQWGNPEEAVTDKKIERIIEAAEFYIQNCDIDLPVRFDVISVLANGSAYEIKHFDDAFFAPLT